MVATILVVTASVAAPAAGAANEWTQYRYSATNNANVSSGLDEVYTGAVPTANEVRATPVIANGTMFVGNHDSGELQAFDLATGEQLWQARAPNWVHSEMIYRDGRVFVGFGNRYPRDELVRGTPPSGVLALDADTGEQLWRYDTKGEVMPTPALVGDSLYAVTGDSHLYELDPATGEERHVEELRNRVSMSSPAAVGDMLYFGGGKPQPYAFYAYDTAADAIAWRTEFDEVDAGLDDVPPAVADGTVVTTANRRVPDGSDGTKRAEHIIVAMDVVSGDIEWQHTLGTGQKPTNNRSGAPMIHNGAVFVGSPTTDEAYAYDLESGEQLWHTRTGAIKGAPAANKGRVYFSTTAGQVYSLDQDTGEKQGSLELTGTLAPAGPVIVDDKLISASQSAHVYITPLDEIEDRGNIWGWVAGAVVVVLFCGVAIVVITKRRRSGSR